MEYVEVELSTGEKVKIYAPPSIKLNQIVQKKYPDPLPPVRESTTVTGDIIKMAINDDPDYLKAKETTDELRLQELNELTLLFALKDVKVPADFSMDDTAEILRLTDPSWQPREGVIGRKLDYIEWKLLERTGDAIKVQEALAKLTGIDLEAVKSIEDSFRDNLEGKES